MNPYLLSADDPGFEEFDEVKWVKPEYGSGRIDAAGKILAARRTPNEHLSMDDALGIAANWRSSHAYPLQVFTTILRNRAKRIDPNAIVVQRLKRMPSIIAKLKRFERMQLSQMQDLGGCRAIVSTLTEVEKLVALYENVPSKVARFYHKHDYIKRPKEDGYRSVHLVYEYQSPDYRRSIYNGNRIELQIRSHLQHVWATAVETVDTFTEQSLKSGIGHNSWKRFFATIASLMSLYEARSIGVEAAADIYENLGDLLGECHSLSEELKVADTLSHLVVAAESIFDTGSAASDLAGSEFYIFLLKLGAPLESRIMGLRDSVAASEKYIELEKEFLGDPLTQLVLVSGDSLTTLRKAYPNYFNDVAEFIGAVEQIDAAWQKWLGPGGELYRQNLPSRK